MSVGPAYTVLLSAMAAAAEREREREREGVQPSDGKMARLCRFQT
jgi:hypothetical protein